MDTRHREAAGLRRNGPVHRFTDRPYGEFWAVTQHHASSGVKMRSSVAS